jgi:hypothetical protein
MRATLNQPQRDLEQLAPDARTIPEFCVAWRISIPHFYRLSKKGLMPDLFEIGDRVLIKREAEKDWKQRTQAATNRLRAEKRDNRQAALSGNRIRA